MEYKFHLDKTSRKHSCPKCGHKTFVAYVYIDSGQAIDASKYGRCDRENKCTTHIKPQNLQYNWKSNIPQVQQIYPDQKLIDSIINQPQPAASNFHQFCKAKKIPENHLIRWGVYTHNLNTVFIYQNRQQKTVNLKWIRYQKHGHRDKAFKSHSHRQPKTTNSNKIVKYFLCLFGEHLLDPNKKKTVCIVESEKSAIIASYFYPQFDWVACGSASGLSDGTNQTADKITPLFGRKIYWIADADKAGRNNSSINNLNRYELDFNLLDLFPEHTNGYDISDALIDGLRPDIKPTPGTIQPKEDDIQAYLYNLPQEVIWNDVKMEILRYNHFQHQGQIYMVRKPSKEGGNYSCKAITNFTIKPLGLILSRNNPRRLIEIKNIHRHHKVLEVPTKAFASHTEFTVFVESEGNFQFDGIALDLKKIRSKLYDNMASYEEIESLGWHNDGYFIFANGVFNGRFNKIDDYGFVNLDQKNYYIEPLSQINKGHDTEWDDEKKFIYREAREMSIKSWAELFCEVHGENGKIVLIWYISSLFRDHIYKRLKFFPHWFGFGPPGTGKSQVGWSIRATAFSGIKKPFNLSLGTPVAFSKEVSQFANVPCWYDEYENNIDPARIQGLKGFYDGSGHIKSIKDSKKRTETVPVLSACMITGQQLPIVDIALFTRVILCQFHKSEFSKEEREKFNKMEKLHENGLPFIITFFIKFRKVIEDKYHDLFDIIANQFQKEFDSLEVHTCLIRNFSILLTTFKVLEDEISNIIPFSFQDFWTLAIHNVKEQASLIRSANETNTFWDMVSYLIDQKLIQEKTDYAFATKSEIKLRASSEEPVLRKFETTKELLFLRFSRIVPLYKEHFNKQNRSAQPMDKGSLLHYLQHSKPFIGSVKNYRFDGAPTTAFVFDYQLLRNQDIQLKRTDQDNPPMQLNPPYNLEPKQMPIEQNVENMRF